MICNILILFGLVSGSYVRDSTTALEIAKFFAIDVGLYERWRSTIEDAYVRERLCLSNDFGSSLPLIEQELLGESESAWSWVAGIPTESEDEQEALFRSVFVIKILESLKMLIDEDGSLSEKSLHALGVIAKENFVDSDRLIYVVTHYFIN